MCKSVCHFKCDVKFIVVNDNNSQACKQSPSFYSFCSNFFLAHFPISSHWSGTSHKYKTVKPPCCWKLVVLTITTCCVYFLFYFFYLTGTACINQQKHNNKWARGNPIYLLSRFKNYNKTIYHKYLIQTNTKISAMHTQTNNVAQTIAVKAHRISNKSKMI